MWTSMLVHYWLVPPACAIYYIVKYIFKKNSIWIRFYLHFDDQGFALMWLPSADMIFSQNECGRSGILLYFTYWQSYCFEYILLRLQNLGSLDAEFAFDILLQMIYSSRPLLKSVLPSERYSSIHRMNFVYTSQCCKPGSVHGRRRTWENKGQSLHFFFNVCVFVVVVFLQQREGTQYTFSRRQITGTVLT